MTPTTLFELPEIQTPVRRMAGRAAKIENGRPSLWYTYAAAMTSLPAMMAGISALAAAYVLKSPVQGNFVPE